MLLASFILAVTLGSIFEPHTISFDEIPEPVLSVDYRVYQRAGDPDVVLHNPWTQWVWTCSGSPCDLELRIPAAGNIVFVSVVAFDGEEGPH